VDSAGRGQSAPPGTGARHDRQKSGSASRQDQDSGERIPSIRAIGASRRRHGPRRARFSFELQRTTRVSARHCRIGAIPSARASAPLRRPIDTFWMRRAAISSPASSIRTSARPRRSPARRGNARHSVRSPRGAVPGAWRRCTNARARSAHSDGGGLMKEEGLSVRKDCRFNDCAARASCLAAEENSPPRCVREFATRRPAADLRMFERQRMPQGTAPPVVRSCIAIRRSPASC